MFWLRQPPESLVDEGREAIGVFGNGQLRYVISCNGRYEKIPESIAQQMVDGLEAIAVYNAGNCHPLRT